MAISFEPQRRLSGWRRVAYAVSLTLSWILQRTPFSVHCCIVLLAALGPIFAPHLIALLIVLIHIVFVICQSRTAWGVWCGWRGVLQHSRRDWRQYHADERAKLDRNGSGDHVLEIDDVQHIIILPAYKETVETLRETLDVLASHPIASSCYHVCLGMEEREAGAAAKANKLLSQYRLNRAFATAAFSLHPGNILGESAGKASNVNWAARHMARSVPIDHSRTVVTVMDADTAFASDFFLSISAYFALAPLEKRRRTYYVPPTLFDRNGAEVPATTRIADIMWSCAGIGQIYPSSSFKAPTSAYAATMDLVKHCDFWDSGPEAVGEDFHFAVKATFDTRGSVFAQTIYSPASQTNVVGAPSHSSVLSYLNDMHARWSQAVRHLWGSLDFGYAYHRALTGAFGPGQRKTGYVALMTQDADENADDDDVTINGDRLKPPHYFVNGTLQVEDPQRFPSPSTTATTDSTLVDACDPMSLPRPAKKFARFDDDGDADSEDTIRKVTQTHHRTLSKYGERLDVSTAESFSRRGSDASFVGDGEDLELGKLLASDKANARNDDDDEELWNPPLRIKPFFAVFFRIFEAHIMIAAIFLSMQILTFYPTVVYRNGHVGFSELPGRKCTWQKCAQAIFESPFSADMPIPEGTAPGLHPAWLLPDIVMCSIRAARLLTVFGILATIFVLLAHDYYHRAASQTRWLESEQVLRAWRERGSQGPVPARYLGTRPGQTFARKWPKGLLDFLAFPAAILYGVAPMLYAQLCHLHTNKLTYTVSGKSKSTVVIATPFVAEAEVRVSSDVRCGRGSLDTARTVRQSIEIGRLSVDEHGMDRYYRPERNLPSVSRERQDPVNARQKQG